MLFRRAEKRSRPAKMPKEAGGKEARAAAGLVRGKKEPLWILSCAAHDFQNHGMGGGMMGHQGKDEADALSTQKN